VTRGPGDPLSQRYEICVRGRVGETVRLAFPGFQADVRSGDTVLTGGLADSAALYGVLAELEALGLELLEVRRLPRC
jgi:predicted acylesterase/phospholipase RssA